jgi:hypothetical protein
MRQCATGICRTCRLFAYICRLIDRRSRDVGQGRGAADLRENTMNNVNKAVKLAEKRAMVDARPDPTAGAAANRPYPTHSPRGGSRPWSHRPAAARAAHNIRQRSGSQMASMNVARDEVTARPVHVVGLGRCSFYGASTLLHLNRRRNPREAAE